MENGGRVKATSLNTREARRLKRKRSALGGITTKLIFETKARTARRARRAFLFEDFALSAPATATDSSTRLVQLGLVHTFAVIEHRRHRSV